MKESRKQAARLLKKRIQELKGNVRVIVTGDFNAREDSDPYLGLVDGKILDTYRMAHKSRTEEAEHIKRMEWENIRESN